MAEIFQKTILYSGSLGSGVDEERSKLRVSMRTAGHMSIDILNAYCGPSLVDCPRLAQGRLSIHPTSVGIELSVLLKTVASSLTVLDLLVLPTLGLTPGLAIDCELGALETSDFLKTSKNFKLTT